MRASRHGGVFAFTNSPPTEWCTLVGTNTLPHGSVVASHTEVNPEDWASGS